METNKEESPIFAREAKTIVDLLFDAKMFKASVTRDDMLEVESLVCYLMDTRYKSQKKAEELMEKIKSHG
jgi:hypothetical protein